MKTFDKDKFWFLRDQYVKGARTWSRKDAEEGDVYINEEYRWGWEFPFYKKQYISYKLIGGKWIEQE